MTPEDRRIRATGARQLLEQRKFTLPFNKLKDHMGKSRISGAEVRVQIRDTQSDEAKARILKIFQPKTMSEVILSLELVFHPWLGRDFSQIAIFPIGTPSSELQQCMAIEKLSSQVMGNSHAFGTFFSSTLRIVTRPGALL